MDSNKLMKKRENKKNNKKLTFSQNTNYEIIKKLHFKKYKNKKKPKKLLKYYAKKSASNRIRNQEKNIEIEENQQNQNFGGKIQLHEDQNNENIDINQPLSRIKDRKSINHKIKHYDNNEDLLSALEYYKSLNSALDSQFTQIQKVSFKKNELQYSNVEIKRDEEMEPNNEIDFSESTNIWQKIIDSTLSKNSYKISEMILDDLMCEIIQYLNKFEEKSSNEYKKENVKHILLSIQNEQENKEKILKISEPVEKENIIDIEDISKDVIESSKKYFKKINNYTNSGTIFDFYKRQKSKLNLEADLMMNIFKNQVEFEDYVIQKNYLTKEYVYANELTIEEIIEDLTKEIIEGFIHETNDAVKEILENEIYQK
jgi:hypothetical protein